VSYIFRAGSNLVSSSIKRKYEKKEGTNPWDFFFIRSPIGSRVCLTICTASHKSVKFYIFVFLFRFKKKIVHFFVFQVFDSVKNSIDLIGQNLMFVFS
jgi:hypothetical protein